MVPTHPSFGGMYRFLALLPMFHVLLAGVPVVPLSECRTCGYPTRRVTRLASHHLLVNFTVLFSSFLVISIQNKTVLMVNGQSVCLCQKNVLVHVTYSFDLLTSKFNQFMSVPNEVVNLAKFPQVVCTTSC